MKLNAKQKDLLKLLVKGKGKFQTPVIPKTSTEKNFDNIVKLYLKGLLTFRMKRNKVHCRLVLYQKVNN